MSGAAYTNGNAARPQAAARPPSAAHNAQALAQDFSRKAAVAAPGPAARAPAKPAAAAAPVRPVAPAAPPAPVSVDDDSAMSASQKKRMRKKMREGAAGK